MKPAHLTLLFTSDEHGYLKPAPKLQSAVQQAREANPEGTLLLSSGDVFEGAAETGVLGLDPSRKLLAEAGYDVITLGNHDFDRGPETALRWAAEAPCSVLLCNVQHEGKPLPNTRSSEIFELNGVKLGLIGVTTPETTTILPASKLTGLTFEDPATAVAAEVQSLKEQGVELIGLVSHLGLSADRQLAGDLAGSVDFILGGHTHDALTAPETVNGTLIAHPGCFRQGLGQLELDVNPENGQVLSHEYQLLRADGLESAPGAVKELVDASEALVDQAMGEEVAVLKRSYRHDTSQLNGDMDDLSAEAALNATGAEVVMINHKGIRAPLRQGAVTKADLFNVFPFDNRLVTVDMKVGELARIYEESDRRFDATWLTSGGLTSVAADCRDHKLHLVQEIQPGDDTPPGVREGHGSEFRRMGEDETVRVATTDYLLQGGLGYVQGQRSPVGDHGTLREALETHLRGI